MRQTVIAILAVFASILLFAAGNTLLGTLSSLRLAGLGFGAGLIGPILACYAVGFVAGTFYSGNVIRSVGHIRAASAFAACAGAAALMHPMVESVPAWAVLRAVIGFSIGGLLVSTESWISDRATNTNRGTLFSLYQVLFYLAAFGGQAMVAVSDPSGFPSFSLAAILVTLALVPLALTRQGAPMVETAQRLGFRDLFRASPVGLTCAFLSGVALGAFNMMGPAYGSLSGLSVPQVSVFMSASVAGAMVVAWPTGFISDRVDRRRVLALSALVSAAATTGLALSGTSPPLMLYALAAVFMGFTATFYPLSVSITNDRLESHQMVSASAALLLSHGLGSCVGPVGGALFMVWLGPAGLFVFLAAVCALLVFYAVQRILRTPAIEVEQQEHFVPVASATTPVIAELYSDDEPAAASGEEFREPNGRNS